MRVAFFIPVIAGRGGVESVVTNLLQEMHAGGDEPRLYIYSGSREKRWLENLPWVKEIGAPTQSKALRLWTYLWQTIKEMRQWRPEAIVCTHPSTMRLARMCCWLTGARNVPVVLWLHGPLAYFPDADKFLSKADGHICICEERAEEVRTALPRLKVKPVPPVFVAYNGTSIASRYSLKRADIPTFLYIGRLMFGDEKRVGDIVSAAGQLRGDFRIRFVGDGAEEVKRQLFQCADEAGVSEKLEWLGWQSEPWSKVQEATALIMASSFEGFSMAVVESVALGLPVICSNYVGATEVINDKTGWLFPVGDVAALVKLMQGLMDQTLNSPSVEEVRQFGSQFDAANMAKSFHSALATMRVAK